MVLGRYTSQVVPCILQIFLCIFIVVFARNLDAWILRKGTAIQVILEIGAAISLSLVLAVIHVVPIRICLVYRDQVAVIWISTRGEPLTETVHHVFLHEYKLRSEIITERAYLYLLSCVCYNGHVSDAADHIHTETTLFGWH